MIISTTSDETIFPKAQPITTATARSRTFPLRANSLNSCIKPLFSIIFL